VFFFFHTDMGVRARSLSLTSGCEAQFSIQDLKPNPEIAKLARDADRRAVSIDYIPHEFTLIFTDFHISPFLLSFFT